MTIRIALATLLADAAGGQSHLEGEGATVGEVLRRLSADHAKLHRLLWGEDGEFNPILVAFRNDEDVRSLEGMDTPVAPGDEVTVISALEGG